jgi:hypothetical protein
VRSAALSILPAALLAADEAAAQRRIEMNCPQMAATVAPATVWWGRFSGGREFNRGGVLNRTTEACFRTRQECERWLYDLKSEYQYDPRWNQCRLGYVPGAPIPRL